LLVLVLSALRPCTLNTPVPLYLGRLVWRIVWDVLSRG
jgi:hypothetical protein